MNKPSSTNGLHDARSLRGGAGAAGGTVDTSSEHAGVQRGTAGDTGGERTRSQHNAASCENTTMPRTATCSEARSQHNAPSDINKLTDAAVQTTLFQQSVPNWLLKQAQLNGEHCAIDDGQTQLTFTQVYEQACKRAAYFSTCTKKSSIGLLCSNCIDGYLAALGILMAGKTIVWLNWRLSTRELTEQANDSQLDCILLDERLNMRTFDKRCIYLDSYQTWEQNTPESTIPASAHAPFSLSAVASVMYTSGTTGKAKSVPQTFGNHFASAVSSALNLGVLPSDVWLCATPLFHISGFSIIMRSLIYGMTVRLVSHFNAQHISAILCDEAISIMSVVPYMLRTLLALAKKDQLTYNAAMRVMLVGGGVIDKATLEECSARNIPVVQCYGMTETCSQIVALSANDAARKLGSVGKPLFTTQLRIDPQTSEICIKTPALTPGYGNVPSVFAERTYDGWYHTGDSGYLDDEGFLYLKGRLDDMIISGGENIYPAEIEQVLLHHSAVGSVSVVGAPSSTWGHVPVAFFVLSGSALKEKQKAADETRFLHEIEQSVIAYARKHLAHYKAPKRCIICDALPSNASGKVLTYVLRKRAQELTFEP